MDYAAIDLHKKESQIRIGDADPNRESSTAQIGRQATRR